MEHELRINLSLRSRMAEEQPSPQEANRNLDTTVDGTSGEIEMEERRSTRVRQASVVRDREGDLNEKKLALHKSRAGHIGNLTKVYNEIAHLMESDASPEDVLRERVKFDEAWRRFVDAHESCLELLDSPTDALVLEKAQTIYDEQLKRKLDLDFDVRLWRKDREPERGEYHSMFSGEMRGSRRSGVSRSSSRLSTVSRKKEKLALAQLNLRQLKIRQQLDEQQHAIREKQEKEEQEIRRKKELLEAEMEAERAAVSLQVYEEIDKSEKNPFLEYLEPASREDEVPDSMSKLSANDQSAVPLENATMVETPALSSGVGKVELIVPVSVELSTSFPATTVTLSNSLAGNMSTVPTPRIWKPQHPSPHFMSSKSSSPLVDSLVAKTEPKQTSPGRFVESWSSSWQIPQPSVPQEVKVETTNQQFDSGQEMVKALRQVVSSPKVEYHRFDGDPLKYVTFTHNFETYLEKDNPGDSRRLQLLIQHCTGKAREAIESCANLPNDGYRVAKQTLRENFGKPHVIAEAHVKKLLGLPCLKNVDGPALLEFSRHLDTADRTLTGMGTEYVSDLNHMNTLRELAKKLPMFLRGRWTECAGKIIGLGRRPKFQDFVTFVKERAKLVDNEFGRDMVPGSLKETPPRRNRVNQSGNFPGLSSFVAGTGPTNQSDNARGLNFVDARAACLVCSKQHNIWKCSKFKGLTHEEKWRVVRSGGLCNKCLEKGHISKECPKVNFNCQRPGCGGNHHTLMHRPTGRIARDLSNGSNQRDNASTGSNDGTRVTTERQLLQVSSGARDVTGAGNGNGIAVAATGAGETRVCLGIVPVKVRGKSNNQIVETYALLDNGSEVTLCHEQLVSELELDREKLRFTLTGITGSNQMESHVVNLTIMSMDESIAVELPGVRTVAQMPVSRSCIPREGDLARWPHLQGVDIPAVRDTEVLLLIGLKEKPSLFLPLEVKAGEVDEPIAIRYSLGWTVMGPMGEHKKDEHCSVNFLQSAHDINLDRCLLNEKSPTEKIGDAELNLETAVRSESIGSGMNRSPIAKLEQQAVINLPLSKEEQVEYDIDNETLQRQLERLWKTDFGDSEGLTFS